MTLTEKLAKMVRNDADDRDETYECETCGARFSLDRQSCPDCGGCAIDRIDWETVVSG